MLAMLTGWSMARRVAVSFLAGATLVGAVPLTALAGSNGQQLEPNTWNPRYMCNTGPNQNNTVISACFAVYHDTKINGWWWKGQQNVTFYDGSWNWMLNDHSSNVNVPTSQWWSNYWYFEEAV